LRVYDATGYGKRLPRHWRLPQPVVSVFEQLRQSLNDLLERATKPEERRAVVTRMKNTLVQAKIGLDETRDQLRLAERKLEVERRELETVRRRKELAAGINDAETIKVAERFEKQHGDKVAVLEQKIAAMTQEVALAEREVEEMKAEIRTAMIGGPAAGAAGAAGLEDPLEGVLDEDQAASNKVRDEIDALARQRARADRDADADRRLEELKKKMGK
jgi:hypothetical protein